MSDISIKKAVIINFISKYSNIIVQLILNSILARLLTPNDYGVVAVITVFTTFFGIISNLGIGSAVIQNKELEEEDITSIYSFTIIIAIITAIVFIIFSIPLSYFYVNKVYIKLGAILSFSIFFNVLNMVPNALLSKDKRFKEMGIRTVLVTIASGIITIILAFLGFKYYAIVINSVLVAFFSFICNYKLSKLKMKFSLKKESLNKIKKFSTYQFGFSLVNYFSRNLDNLLIGKIMGNSLLGYYDKAYKLMLYPVQNLTNVITPVLHPILSEYQHDKERIYNEYMKIVKLLGLIGIFIAVFCFFSADEIIRIMFGANWEKSIPSFKILSISIVIQMMTSSCGVIFQATNETKKLFLCGNINTIINVLFIIIGIFAGKIEYVAIAIVVGFYINFFVNYYLIIKKIFNKSLLNFFKVFIPILIIAILCMLSLYIFKIKFNNVLFSIVCKFIIGFVTYVIGLFITNQWKFMINILKK